MGAPSCSNDAPTPQLVPSSHPVPVGSRPGRGAFRSDICRRRLPSCLELFREDVVGPARVVAAEPTRPSTQVRPPPRRPLPSWAVPAGDRRSSATPARGRPRSPLDRPGRRITPPGPCTGGQIRLLGGPCAPRLPKQSHEPGNDRGSRDRMAPGDPCQPGWTALARPCRSRTAGPLRQQNASADLTIANSSAT